MALTDDEKLQDALSDDRVMQAVVAYEGGESVRRIADKLGMSHEWVRSRLHMVGVQIRDRDRAASAGMRRFWRERKRRGEG